MSDQCTWSEDSDGVWQTACGGAFNFFEDGPTENGAKFCPYCGSEIVARKYQEDKDDA